MNLLPFEKEEKTILIKKKSETNPKYGCKPEERKTDEMIDYGVVVINKPKGPTSHQASSYVKGILKIKKAGHSGTLDPRVTGVLPVALGRGTRIVQALLPAGKEYIAIIHFHRDINHEKLKKVLEEFRGKIKQLPPIKSNVKRQWRFRNIYYLETLEIKEKDVLIRVGCEAGTYIRKLAHDIGKSIGTGAHMLQLIRTKAGPFNDNEMYTLQDLTDAFYYYEKENNDNYLRKIIKPVESGVQHVLKIWVIDSAVNSMCHGADLKIPGISKLESGIGQNKKTAIMTLKNELIAIGTSKLSSDEIMKSEKGIAVRTEHVFMLPGVYTKIS
ncbi:MAG: RNA-guided pseudouridylation complex pseudouridine synthase subunit Cbf5 [Nanoarchaeota archaeon]|nr:RNA-guided pseudouridylation complex pseudouridine synthase subunit Cbf5 [Nanoarchaeota archaeon]